jgi:D-arabinose 1-dehydrogenase-like Zn-dependent alcohol dehydrogenase
VQYAKISGGASVAIGLAVDDKSFATAYAGLRRGGRLILVALPARGMLQIPVFDTVLNGTSVKSCAARPGHASCSSPKQAPGLRLVI